LWSIDFYSGEIAREEIGSERNSFKFESKYSCKGFDGFRFPESWDSLEEDVSACKKGYYEFSDKIILSDNRFTDLALDGKKNFSKRKKMSIHKKRI
jgi:hypothetical protein